MHTGKPATQASHPSQPPKPATLIIRGVPGFTDGCAIRTGQTIFIKNNHLTFQHPKYKNHKPEHAEKDSHCHAQQEQGQYK